MLACIKEMEQEHPLASDGSDGGLSSQLEYQAQPEKKRWPYVSFMATKIQRPPVQICDFSFLYLSPLVVVQAPRSQKSHNSWEEDKSKTANKDESACSYPHCCVLIPALSVPTWSLLS